MESLFDLPAHVFFIHVPVVGIPLVGVAAVALVARPSWRRRYGWHLVGGAAAIVVATLLTVSSGNAFNDVLAGAAPTAKHRDLGLTTRNLVFLFFASVVALVAVGAWLHRRAERWRYAPALMGVLSVLTVVAAVLSTIWVIRTGHEGARITWKGVIDS